VKLLEDAHTAAVDAGMKYVYIGNVPGHPREHTYCHQCGKMIIERHGYTVVMTGMIKGHCAFCHAAIPGVWSPV